VEQLQKVKGIRAETELLMQPVLARDMIEEGVPGNIRKAEHFLPVLRKLVLYLKELMKERSTQIKSPLSLVCELQEKHFVEQRTLKFMHQRLQILLNTLQVDRVEDFSALSLVTNLASLLATYYKGFSVIVEPYPSS
jgi:DNA excision repair protein ERCC-2